MWTLTCTKLRDGVRYSEWRIQDVVDEEPSYSDGLICEFFLNDFTEFIEFTDNILKRLFKPATSCERHQILPHNQ